jgi:tetratricopeptide (TPR) repeat protein
MPISRFVYDPWELPPEQRQMTFVGRERILERFLAAVREQEGRATVQHYILTGPRGIGKTALLLMLRDRIRQDPEISAQWFCVQLREEEYYIHKQRDLWQLVLQALAVEEKLVEAQKVADRAEEARDEEKSLALLVDGLRSICSRHGKRLLLLIDNFDHIFPSTAAGQGKHRKRDSEYRAFRKRLSTEGFLMAIASSVKLFQDIYAYDKGFFQFFSPVELPELSQEEAVEMLRRLGRADDNAEFPSRLKRSTVNLQTLSVLTGGNPRLITMLYHILAQREIGEPVQALWETVAELTPMLRQELADMPRQQSKTLDALLRLNSAAAPAEISRTSRLPLNVVTTQLGRLKEARYVNVEGGGKGRKAIYRVADQMFSVWYWMRYVPVARRRIELFIDFLRAWFSLEERKRLFQGRWARFRTSQWRRFGGLAGKSLRDVEYYAASLDNSTQRLREMGRTADAYVTVGDRPSATGLLAELTGIKVKSAAKFESLGYSVLADCLADKGDLDHALKSYSEALAKDPKNARIRAELGFCLSQSGKYAEAKGHFDQVLERPHLGTLLRSLIFLSRGIAQWHLGDRQGAIADYTSVVDLPEANAELVAWALGKRGSTKGELGDSQGEIADYSAVVRLKGAPLKAVALAFLSRGATKGQLGDPQGAVEDCATVLDLQGTSPEVTALALLGRGLAKGELGDLPGAITDYTAVAQLDGVPAEEAAEALFHRGIAKGQLDDLQGAITDFTAVVERKEAPAGQVAGAMVNRGIAKARLGDLQGAIRGFNAVVELKGAPTRQVARALRSRGMAKGQLGDPESAIADYTAAIELGGAPADQVASALLNRGLTKGQLGDLGGEIADHTAVVELRGAPPELVAKALALRGTAQSSLGQYQEALGDFSRSLEIAGLPKEVRIEIILHRGMASEIVGKLEDALGDYAQCAQSGMAPYVHEGLRSTVRLLLAQKRADEALGWVRRFHELEPPEVSLDTRLQARLDMIRVASAVASLGDASHLADALLETDPEELKARLQFLKPGLRLARTNDESVLAKLPEEERKIAREIARSLAEAVRRPA